MDELWSPIHGFENTHEISTHGQVRLLERTGADGRKLQARPLKGRISGSSGKRPSVTLKSNGRVRREYVHVLMLETFVGARPTDMVARHLETDDNIISNLAWGTPSENNYDLVRQGRHANANKTQCPKGHPYTVQWKNGGRRCRECEQERNRRRRGLGPQPVCGHRG